MNNCADDLTNAEAIMFGVVAMAPIIAIVLMVYFVCKAVTK